jgi:hypothetical protein
MRAVRGFFGAFIFCSTQLIQSQTPQPPSSSGAAQPAEAEQNVSDLAKTTQNPVGDVVSVPFQFNFKQHR